MARTKPGAKRSIPAVTEQMIALLEDEGAHLGDLVQATCFLTDIEDLKLFNEAWDQFFGDTQRPTRATVAVSALPFGLRVEITCLARIPSQARATSHRSDVARPSTPATPTTALLGVDGGSDAVDREGVAVVDEVMGVWARLARRENPRGRSRGGGRLGFGRRSWRRRGRGRRRRGGFRGRRWPCRGRRRRC